MITKIEITIDSNDDNSDDEIDAIVNRYKYKRIADDIYEDVFRPIIKYSTDEKR